MSKWATLSNGRLAYPPAVDGAVVNPILSEAWRTAHPEYTLWEDSAIEAQLAAEAAALAAPAPDYTAVDALCADFRDLCIAIRNIISDPLFKGGFQEIKDLLEGEYADNADVISLCNKIGWLNQYITYEANKCGLGQPGWWIRCWENA